MTHRGPFQPLPFCDSVIERMQTELHKHVATAAYFYRLQQLSTDSVLAWFQDGGAAVEERQCQRSALPR